ncbi:DNA alkylation repair protein [Frondihabitans sucicola]|nr:DNA alkylation repair protein [Frondihabitans sucicola]
MPFADELLGRPAALALVDALRDAAPGTPLKRLEAAAEALGPLALRERSDLLRDATLADLALPYAEFAAVVRRAAEGPRPFSGWLIWPVTSAVAALAVADGSTGAFDDALDLLAELTPRLTSEFAIRVLLRHDLDRALDRIRDRWLTAEDEHVRRLASEGTRPYLPWSSRVPGILQDPAATVPILTALYRDESEYVRRSVANHLNDISRHAPGLVVDTAAAWLAAPDASTRALVRRALRTLVKKGDPAALALLGFEPAELEITSLTLDRTVVAVGESVTFSARVTNRGRETARLAIDYIVHHRKANGTTTGKTFKLTVTSLAPGETLDLAKQHSFRVITTRRYHPGQHAIELQVNGIAAGRTAFELLPG